MAQDEEFVFNGIDGATGSYLLAPMTAHEITELAQGRDPDEVQQEAADRYEELRDFPPRADVDPKDLSQAGWGVIFPNDADPAILEALRPLIEHRRAEASAIAERRFRLIFEDGYRPGERKRKFLERFEAPTSGPVDPDGFPYYLTLVGSADQIPSEFQAQLDLQHAVGRLCFEKPDGTPDYDAYASYAQSVIDSETGKIALPKSFGLFGVKNDRATELSAEGLIAGLDRYIPKHFPSWAIHKHVEAEATKEQLAKMLGGDETPTVLFTASHGMGFPNGHERQLAHQGALLCQDWAPGSKVPLTPDHYFAGEDLGSSAKLAGLIAFFFACYGGGTPRYDAFFHRSGGERKEIAPRSFFGQLPTRMLGHPKGGALATVAHVERAWGCSFYGRKSGHQIAVFESFMHRLLDGHPVGSAMDYFGERYGELSAELVDKLEDIKWSKGDKTPSEREIANDWTANNDARNYLVIGDPAVRLPVSDDGKTTQRPAVEVVTQSPAQTVAKTMTLATEAIASDDDTEADVDYGLFGGKKDDDGSGMLDSLRGFVAKLGERISGALDDMATLEVKTYVARDMDQVRVEGDEVVGARLRAFTRISLDGDMVVCLPERDGEVDQALLDIHQRMVQQAQTARTELMKTIIGATASLTDLIK